MADKLKHTISMMELDMMFQLGARPKSFSTGLTHVTPSLLMQKSYMLIQTWQRNKQAILKLSSFFR